MSELSFFFPYTPYPYTRIRGNRISGVFYTPEKYATYKKLLSYSAKTQMKENKYHLLLGAVELKKCIFYFFPPQSWSRKKKQMALANEIKHTSKPDIDNLVKGLFDSLNGIVFEDDKNIWKKQDVEKLYTDKREGIELIICNA